MSYIVVSGYSKGNIAEIVLRYIEDGWQPIGGVNIIKSTHLNIREYSQAMVKREICGWCSEKRLFEACQVCQNEEGLE